jgi:hypothetical protein
MHCTADIQEAVRHPTFLAIVTHSQQFQTIPNPTNSSCLRYRMTLCDAVRLLVYNNAVLSSACLYYLAGGDMISYPLSSTQAAARLVLPASATVHSCCIGCCCVDGGRRLPAVLITDCCSCCPGS